MRRNAILADLSIRTFNLIPTSYLASRLAEASDLFLFGTELMINDCFLIRSCRTILRCDKRFKFRTFLTPITKSLLPYKPSSFISLLPFYSYSFLIFIFCLL